ncbi:tyrosine-protein phosphatase [Novosphingobium tardum]|uniref:Tyrosine-protein phosphatase n=1 Tax=Novosphingobium tardum TaxID=1538021 RepID=A0ABV8RS20_9SPHN
MQHRVLPMTGIHNFRDYGNYPAADGARVKAGRLWRSGQHIDATAQDLERVSALGLSKVIDLRGDSEREKYPCARPEDFAAEVLFFAGETAGLGGQAVHEEAGAGIVTADDAHRAMVRLYQGMAWRPILVGTYRLYFDALAAGAEPSLLHCLAGKDRTGLAVALAHHVLGVHADDAMSDYLLTNEAGNIDARIEAGAKTIRASHGEAIEDDAVRTLMSVDPAFLEEGLGAIRERHGSLDAYLDEVLGVSPEKAAAIRANYLA